MTTAVGVNWAFIVGVDDEGHITLIDHDDAFEVNARRAASLDDIYAASIVGAAVKNPWFTRPSPDTYTLAFVVFQLPDGNIAASPNIFENIVPSRPFPSQIHVTSAFGVLQGQIIAQKTANAIQLAAAMSRVKAADPDAAKKTAGGLYVA